MRAKTTFFLLFFVGAALLCSFVLTLAFTDLFSLLRIQNTPILGDSFTLATLVGFTISFVAAIYFGIVNKRVSGLVEQCIVELEKVAWPSWSETKISTVTVVATSFVAAVILGVFDSFFSWVTSKNLFL